MNNADVDDLRSQIDSVLPAARADLEALVTIPSISSDPARAGDVRAAIERVRDLALAGGAADATVVASGAAPALVAHWPAPPGMPTVLLYAHADVQPTGPVEQWTSDPFTPTERDGRLYGRGAADDKAGVAMHLAVLRAFGGRPPVGVTLFIEGEEEIGSPTIAAILAEHADALRSDVIVIADSANTAVDVPAFTTSLRGLVDLVVEVRTAGLAVHSGMFGGVFPDALTVLCRLLATLHDADGAVAIPGLVSGSGAPEADEAALRGDVQAVPGLQTIGSGCLHDRLWHHPAVSILGMDAPSVAEASNILVPRARAKVSLRIAPGDEAGRAMKALADHLTAHVEWGAEVEVTEGSAGEPFALEATGDVYALARAAFGDAYGNAAVETGIGGSIPFIAEFARRMPGATVLVTGVGDPQSRWHGIDESLDLAMWGRACLAEALLLARLAERANPAT
jgi:acetylornithine deacetylase/succinyl-diaminopimelate desuccinylase-like protein